MDNNKECHGLQMLTEGALKLGGLDDAILGVSDQGLLVYDYRLVMEHFIKDGMEPSEAEEWIDFNILGLQGNGAGFVMLYRKSIDC